MKNLLLLGCILCSLFAFGQSTNVLLFKSNGFTHKFLVNGKEVPQGEVVKQCTACAVPLDRWERNNNAAIISLGLAVGGMASYFVVKEPTVKNVSLGLGFGGAVVSLVAIGKASKHRKSVLSTFNK